MKILLHFPEIRKKKYFFNKSTWLYKKIFLLSVNKLHHNITFIIGFSNFFSPGVYCSKKIFFEVYTKQKVKQVALYSS